MRSAANVSQQIRRFEKKLTRQTDSRCQELLTDPFLRGPSPVRAQDNAGAIHLDRTQIQMTISSAPSGLVAIIVTPPRLKPGLSSQGPSGRNRLQIRQAPGAEVDCNTRFAEAPRPAVAPRYGFQYLTSVTGRVRLLMSALERSNTLSEATLGGRFKFPGTSLTVQRIGYGAMQLAGPGVWGPPKDPDGAVAVLREAVAAGVNHIDTADFYGPHVTNQIIRQALHPYPTGVVIVTKLGARRPPDKSWQPAISPQDLTAGVHDNLRNLGLDALDIVNYRVMGSGHGPEEGSIAEQVTVLADLQRKGLIRHIGLSNVTAAQVAEAQAITDVVCVQNNYNLAHRHDDALIDDLARQGIAYVPFFPLGGFSPLQSSTLSSVAGRLGATPMQVALAWLLQRSPNILLIPGTSSVAHLRENLAAGQLTLSPQTLAELDGIAAAAVAVEH
jgi:pyridoxine 4-dehydrogenase